MEPKTLRKRIKLHQAQYDFRHCPAIYRGFIGGRGAGKTFVGAYDLIRRARPDCTYLIASPTGVLLGDTTFPTFRAIARDLGVLGSVKLNPYPTANIRVGEGLATVRFRTAEDPERLRGPNLSGAWLDEASLMDEEAYHIVIAALREHGRQGWLCLAGEEELYDPVARRARRIDEIGEWFHVYSLDERTGRRVVARASPPFRKGVAPLYRYHLSNGLSFVAPLQHYVLAYANHDAGFDTRLPFDRTRVFPQSDGTISLASRTNIGDASNCIWLPLRSCVPGPPGSECGVFPEDGRGNVLHCCCKFPSSLGDYPPCRRFCGEQLRPAQGCGQEWIPSLGGALRHSLAWLLADDLDSECTDNHSEIRVLRHATSDCDAPYIPSGAIGCHASCTLSESVVNRGPVARRFLDSSDHHPHTMSEFVQLASLSYSIEPLHITSYEYVRTDWYYDLTVPLYHNYEHCELIHHNSATFTPKGFAHWTYEIFGKERPDTHLIRAKTAANPFLPPDFAETLAKQYAGNEARIAQELGGEFTDMDGAEWPAEYFDNRIWYEHDPPNPAVKVTALDPSLGKDKKRGDFQAVVNLTVTTDMKLYVEADLLRVPAEQLMDVLVGRIRAFGPHVFAVESNAFQQLLAVQFRDKAKAAGVLVPVQEVVNTVEKSVRIRRIGPYLAERRLFFRDTPGTRLLVQQMRSFPLGEHDDGPDALELAIRVAAERINKRARPPEVSRYRV